MKKKKLASEDLFRELLQKLGDDEPVEFQLPDWSKQRKLTPYTSYTAIRRNVYLTKKMKTRVPDEGIFCSCILSPGMPAVCGKDCLCGMLLSCCSMSCKCGNLCINKPFQYRPVKQMKLIETEKCGAGIVTEEDIKRGDFVIEYVGEVIDDKTCEERLWKMKHCGDTNFYLCEISRDMVIDATFKGNKSRFINHSCQPNTEMQKWTIDGEIRIGIFATRDIKKGEELTYDYKFVQFGADQNCYCGSVGCRKKLGSKPGKLKIPTSDDSLELILCQMAASAPSSKSLLYAKTDLQSGRPNMGSCSLLAPKRKSDFESCVGEVVRVWSPQDKRYYGGVILAFHRFSKEHTSQRMSELCKSISRRKIGISYDLQ
ncbi:histone-lysine N-methyltransferase ASHH3-like isoform X1 [Zingiber officinale]|uniref:histone-lysine N-methyltransferase ASHH3-like isoform X1 n=1 Tax=Zingiber officinale TaxID=94328 RepID=UPI001C4ABCB5|nr:histone-lysine N-methyltransferase ASHH3-like isoform X1 [Zingiber officinale]